MSQVTNEITRLRVVPASKSTTGQAVVIIEREGHKDFDIVRSEPLFLIDLKNSFLIGDHVNSINDPEVREVLARINAGEFYVKGDIENAAKDSTYVLDEYSAEVRQDPSLIGQTRTRSRATAVVARSSFLNFVPTIDTRQVTANANAYGSKLASLMARVNVSTSAPVQAAAPAQPQAPATPVIPQGTAVPVEEENNGGGGDANAAGTEGAEQGQGAAAPEEGAGAPNGKKK